MEIMITIYSIFTTTVLYIYFIYTYVEKSYESSVRVHEASTVWEGVSILTESGEWVDRGPLIGDIGDDFFFKGSLEGVEDL